MIGDIHHSVIKTIRNRVNRIFKYLNILWKYKDV